MDKRCYEKLVVLGMVGVFASLLLLLADRIEVSTESSHVQPIAIAGNIDQNINKADISALLNLSKPISNREYFNDFVETRRSLRRRIVKGAESEAKGE